MSVSTNARSARGLLARRDGFPRNEEQWGQSQEMSARCRLERRDADVRAEVEFANAVAGRSRSVESNEWRLPVNYFRKKPCQVRRSTENTGRSHAPTVLKVNAVSNGAGTPREPPATADQGRVGLAGSAAVRTNHVRPLSAAGTRLRHTSALTGPETTATWGARIRARCKSFSFAVSSWYFRWVHFAKKARYT